MTAVYDNVSKSFPAVSPQKFSVFVAKPRMQANNSQKLLWSRPVVLLSGEDQRHAGCGSHLYS